MSMIYPCDPPEIKDPTVTGDTDIDSILLECVRLLEVKGNDYTQGAGSSDRLKNFNDGAEMFGMEPRQVLGVYLWKHLSAVLRYIKEGQVESEPIESRIVDSINYLLLLAKIVKSQAFREQEAASMPLKSEQDVMLVAQSLAKKHGLTDLDPPFNKPKKKTKK